MPPNACDTHAHVFSASTAYPLVDTRVYTPPPAPEEKYLAMLAGTGCSRGVLIQISVYGTDNRYMLEVLNRHRNKLRGIAVVSPTVTDRELQAMHDAGVRGLRINVLYGGGIGFEAMESLAHRIAPMGWHMQFLVDARDLPALMPRMRALPCPGVIDHIGHMPVALGFQDPGFQAMRELVVDHGYWIKLSGAYRISDDTDHFADVTPVARSLIEAAPDRMLWGSDWPHVAMTKTMPNTGHLRNLLKDWAPDSATRNRILVDNPARLYGFPA
jgi:predicted TIM-barrel fold metal-dependent hydrolase